MIKVMFGLRLKNKKDLLKYTETSNGDADCCNEMTVELSEYGDKDLTVEEYNQALFAKYNTTHWYNSCIEHPKNKFKAEELEIVEIVININNFEEKKHLK